jgi:hypothetical protein
MALSYNASASKNIFPTDRQGSAGENGMIALVMPFHGRVPGIAPAAIL